MKKITCIAIDDEPIALLVITQFCERKGGLELATFSEPRIGLEEIVRRKPDLVFLDIEMNSISGLDVAQSLPKECCLIFTTAHAQYALDGFDLDAVDFLHKPFAYDRFDRAVEKAIRHIEARRGESPRAQMPEVIVVKHEYNNVTIPISDIFYVEALENYIKIFRKNGSNILSRINIKTICEMLPKNAFLRVHRSYIIPVDKVEQFSKQEIRLTGLPTPIPVGRRYAKEIFDILSRKNADVGTGPVPGQ